MAKKHTVKSALLCVGFDPMTYKYYIDRQLNGITFKFYCYNKRKVLEYVYYRAVRYKMPLGVNKGRKRKYNGKDNQKSHTSFQKKGC